METIFRKVSAKERLPFALGDYDTNMGLLNYYDRHSGNWRNKAGYGTFKPDWWFEEIELPTDEDIKKEYSYGMRVTASYQQRMDDMRKGAKWMRDFVLAVAPLTSKTNGV